MRTFYGCVLFLAGMATPAYADVILIPPLAPPCFDRPGLGTPDCTIGSGRWALELGIADWTRDAAGPMRSDALVIGDTLLRYGVSEHGEVQIGWTAFGRESIRDRAAHTRESSSGVGDVTLAYRHQIRDSDAGGIGFAVMPYVQLPTGGQKMGAGDWGAGFLIPASVDLGGPSLALTAQVDAVPDGDRKGRHLGYGAVLGLGFDVSDSLSFSPEIALYRDRDPEEHTTQATAGLSLAYAPGWYHQWDIGTNIGLNHATADVQVYFGYARRF